MSAHHIFKELCGKLHILKMAIIPRRLQLQLQDEEEYEKEISEQEAEEVIAEHREYIIPLFSTQNVTKT